MHQLTTRFLSTMTLLIMNRESWFSTTVKTMELIDRFRDKIILIIKKKIYYITNAQETLMIFN